ncbi:MAG: hypothetical protein WAM14_08570 [Candidatus Nitrosopolaris sp.]
MISENSKLTKQDNESYHKNEYERRTYEDLSQFTELYRKEKRGYLKVPSKSVCLNLITKSGDTSLSG